MLKEPFDITREVEEYLLKFISWQIEFTPTNNYLQFARATSSAEDVFKYAAILYPKFINIEGVVILEDHYTKKNWEQWRQTHSPLEAARVVNHVHIEDFLPNNPQMGTELEKGFGELLTFFWQMAVDVQFPKEKIEVEFDGAVIDIVQESIISQTPANKSLHTKA